MIETIYYFLLWTLMIYWVHRLGHRLPIISAFHRDHHRFISRRLKNNQKPNNWHWSNIFLFNDNRNSTVDLWLTEVVPTIIFSWITGQWWILLFYYIWAAFIQERVEHNPDFDLYPFLTSGQSHLLHHKQPDKNYGLFLPVWDIIFGTFKKHN